ncbi:hypothetical protein [Sphingopyxis alaskensis]|jgi:hypothetical protein|uniref:Uncharacterized protein n=1 Tax=Sphingopyxis alaskensis (strain DSM 13593 / LMG 18877 / RB2256) TaxID=317655 RepID=Q1GV69_SPHAL|nr:hypothetical protein [Sphingopyxis alaskensis]ABF52453.1 hypothetical protein Sala_0732 [Sphingopyxis alaskensis RB2256]MCM3420871.1 hypothetical protein [Sphingopyxis alaskensis]
MKSNLLVGAVALALVAHAFGPATAQNAPVVPASADAAPALVAMPVAAPTTNPVRMLPANTEVLLSMNEELSTKKNGEGDTFYMTVLHNVVQDGFIVIPKGARATGEVTWKTGKGAFGKSGKMEIEVRYVDVGGNRIPLIGTFRQEGEGNTVATVAAVALVWVAAPFITGKTGRIPAGRELSVRTKEELAFAVPAGAAAAKPALMAVAVEAAPVAAIPVAAPPPVPAAVPTSSPDTTPATEGR